MHCLDALGDHLATLHHSFGFRWLDHIVIIYELFMADGTLLILFDNLAIQQFPRYDRDRSSRYPLG